MDGTQAAEPILSEDGWWQWDGSAWVPAAVPPSPAPEGQRAAVPEASTVPPWEAAEAAAWSAHAAPVPSSVASGAPVGHQPMAPYPPSGYGPPPGYVGQPYPESPKTGRDGLAVAALVCTLIPLGVTQVLALIFGIIVLTRVGRTGQKGQVMAIVALALIVPMAGISAAIAIPVFLQQRQVTTDAQARITLRNTANAEETYFVENQTFADATQLAAGSTGLVPAGIDEIVSADGSAGYCLTAGRADGTRWMLYDSFRGGLQTTVFTSPDAAIDLCVSTADAGPPAT